MIKRILPVFFAMLIFASMFSVTASAKSETISNVQDAMRLCITDEMFSIKKGTLYKDGKKKDDVYVIILSGSNMKWDWKDPRGLQTCLKSGFSRPNLYLNRLILTVIDEIPKNSKIVLMGHSLGGMVAQQFAASRLIKIRYEIINVLTMGSPYVKTNDMEGGLYRMVDSGDAVPYLSGAGIANFWEGNYSYECNGYFGNPGAAHFNSYQDGVKWIEYDCFGVKGGTSKIILS